MQTQKKEAEEDSVKQIASFTKSIKTIHTVLTDIEKIKINDSLLDVSVMNNSSTDVLLWLCVLSSEILREPVSKKREKLKEQNVTHIKVRAYVEAIHVNIKDFSEKIDLLRKATIEYEENYSNSDESTVFQGYEL